MPAVLLATMAATAQIDTAAAEFGSYRLRRAWTTRDGLPQGSVTSVAQTPDGFLWVGTHGGLARFDGQDFTVFNTVNTKELGSNRIAALKTATDGTLWIGTEGGGCSRLSDGRFLGPESLTGPVPRRIFDIQQAADGSMWLAGEGAAVVVGDRANTVPTDPSPPQDFHKLAVMPTGEILLAANVVLRAAGGRCDVLAGDVVSPFWATSFVAWSPDIGSWGRSGLGFFRLAADGTPRLLRSDDRLDGVRIFGVMRDHQGRDLIATGAGVFRVAFDDDRILLRPALAANTSHRNVRVVFQDREGCMWAGMDPGGLVQFLASEIRELSQAADRLPPGWLSVADDHAGGLWLTSDESPRLWRWLPGGTFQPQTGPGAPDLPGPKDLISARDHTVWIRTERALVSWRDGRATRHDCRELGTPPSGSQLYEDPQGGIWCGSPGHLHCFDGRAFRSYSADDGVPAEHTPRVFTGDDDGGLWFTDEVHVGRLAEGRVTTWTQADGVPREQVRTLHWTGDGSLWIGSYGGGLCRFRNGRFQRVTSAQGLYDDSVSRIEPDDAGNLWINSNRGAYRVAIDDIDAVLAGRRTKLACRALATQECNGNNGCRTGRGWIVFRTLDGLVVIDPEQVQQPPQLPTPLLMDVVADDRRFDPRHPIVVPPGNRDLSFRFTAPTFLDPENTQFAYRLIGLDDGWQPGGNDRTVHFASLPPGSMRFEVAVLDASGNPAGTAGVDLELRPHFHETRWFLGGLLLLAAVTVVGAYEWRHLQSRKRRHELELDIARRAELEQTLRTLAGQLITVQEEERARVARDLHDDLNQRLALLAIDLELFSRQAPPATASPELRRIAESVQDISSAVHRLAYQLHPATLDQLGLFVALRRLCETNQARGLDVAWSEQGTRRLPPQVTLQVFRIAQEALQNALRHGGAKRVEVDLAAEPDRLHLTIRDDGRGFDAERQTTGLGLLSMRERARTLGGRIDIVSQPGRGTRVVVDVPLRPDEDSDA